MSSIKRWIVLCLLFIIVPTSSYALTNWHKKNIARTIVTVVSYNTGDRFRGYGMGAVVGPSTILTAYHVVTDMKKVEGHIFVVDYYNKKYEVSGVILDGPHDLALISLKSQITRSEKLFLASKNVRKKGSLIVPCVDDNNVFSFKSGTLLFKGTTLMIAQDHRGYIFSRVMFFKPAVLHGTSGSPLLDLDGNIVGVITASSKYVGMAQPMPYVRRLLKKAGLYGRP